MPRFYQFFFKFRILHNYYTLGYGKDFKMVPLPQTEALLKRYKLIFKERENGFDIGSLMSDASTPFIDLGEDEILSFALVLTNHAFHNFTALDTLDNARQAYHLDNLNLDTEELTEDGWDLVEPQNSIFAYSQVVEADKVELAITDPFGDEIFNDEIDKGDNEFHHLVQIGKHKEGQYTLTPEVDDVAQEAISYYLAKNLKQLRPFALIDFYSSELDYENIKNYTLQFEAKTAQWTYMLNLGKDYTGSTISIEDTRDSPEITFKSTGAADLTAGSILTFESFDVDDNSVEAEIAYSQTPIADFDLVITKNGDQTEIQGLPNPSIQHTKTEMHINI